MVDVNTQYPARTVREVKEIAKNWVEKHYLGKSGFVGAHLVGSINHTGADELFPIFKDVDIAIVLEEIEHQEIQEVLHEGYILECILSGASRYRDAKEILSLSGMACNLAVDSVIVDPEGKLAKIHTEVARDFDKREYVSLRVEEVIKEAEGSLQEMAGAKNVLEFVFHLGNFIMHCTGMTTVAHLEPPTHRRGLINLKVILENNEQHELYEEYLKTFGAADVDEKTVRIFIEEAASAFDKALEIKKSTVPYDWKLEPCIRPYLVDGSLEMIDEGGHREALFWVALFFMISNSVIQLDGEEAEKEEYRSQIAVFLSVLGLESQENLIERVKMCGAFLAKVKEYNYQLLAN